MCVCVCVCVCVSVCVCVCLCVSVCVSCIYEGLRAKVGSPTFNIFWLKLEKKYCNIKNSNIMFTERFENIFSS